MIGIVIPLRSKRTARDWLRTCELLRQSLHTLEHQSDTRFVYVVVGHERPDFLESHDSAFLSIEIPLPPLAKGGSYHSRKDFDRIIDKNRKIVRGLQHLRDQPVTHWFYMDADDLVSRDLVSELKKLSDNQAAILDEGYVYYSHANRLVKHHQLSEICGSTSVLPRMAFDIPEQLTDTALSQVPWCRSSHAKMDQCIDQLAGVERIMVKRPLIAYVVGHGDNASDEFRKRPLAQLKTWLKPRLIGSRPNRDFFQEFSIEPSK